MFIAVWLHSAVAGGISKIPWTIKPKIISAIHATITPTVKHFINTGPICQQQWLQLKMDCIIIETFTFNFHHALTNTRRKGLRDLGKERE